jgi:hypothetical protein
MKEKNELNDSINDYNNAVDKRVLSFIDEVKEKGPKGVEPIEIGKINKAHADKLQELTESDYTEYKVMLTGDAVQHIENRHGENGKADKSMSDPKDIARIGWVIENFDSAELTGNKSNYKNSDNTRSDIIQLKKRINGNYYVAETAPNSKNKSIYIITAFKNKK